MNASAPIPNLSILIGQLFSRVSSWVLPRAKKMEKPRPQSPQPGRCPTAVCKRESRRLLCLPHPWSYHCRSGSLDLLKRSNPLLSLKELGFEERELDLVVSSRFFKEGKKMKLRDMIRELEASYCGTVGAEFMHIQNPRMRTWCFINWKTVTLPCGRTRPFTAISSRNSTKPKHLKISSIQSTGGKRSPLRAAKP